MANTRQLKKRIKAVANIRRITKTMQMIATARFAAAQQRSVASRPYTDALFGLVQELAGGSGDVTHPLITGPSGGVKADAKELTLILSSDRGLCGPYNSNVLRTALRYFRQTPAAMGGVVELVGKKGVAFLRFNKVTVARQHTQFGDKPAYDDVDALARNYIERFIAGEVSAVRVVSMKYISAGKQVPDVTTLLPFKPEAARSRPGAEGESKAVAQYEFSPSPEELLDTLLPAAVKAVLFQAFNDAIVSEHVARMIAMKAATDNAGKMGKLISRRYNRARQAQITTELTEIISGAAALG
ncbi:MAG: ATP synthase F1 subunit gamma [Phycisphaeraceae bacterium]|nr:ATP synthase F1 subunit gamma [Phycisphaeraceae bacterium]